MVINLISNAIKYTLHGEIRVLLRDVEEDSRAFVRLDVIDTGCGFSVRVLY